MRFFLFLTALFQSALLGAASPWDWGFGAKAGFGSSQFTAGPAHPPKPKTPSTNLFAILAADNGPASVTESPALSGGGGLDLHSGYRGMVEAEIELFWKLRLAQQSQDLGSGITSNVQYSREALEGDLMLKLGYPFAVGAAKSLRPFVEGGAFGNRTLNAVKQYSVSGSQDVKSKAWDGVPNEDWGWIAGLGFEVCLDTRPGHRGFGQRVALEARYEDGQKDIDPAGDYELREKTYMGLLTLSY